MQRSIRIVAVAVAMASIPALVWAQKPSAYPANHQSAQQQSSDDAQCLAWAQQDTGINPAAVASTPPPSGPQGERLRGAARGAAAGAVVGEIVDDDAGRGAAVGGAAGVLAGGHRTRKNIAAQTQQAQAAQGQAIDTYYRAYGACMQGRGYSLR